MAGPQGNKVAVIDGRYVNKGKKGKGKQQNNNINLIGGVGKVGGGKKGKGGQKGSGPRGWTGTGDDDVDEEKVRKKQPGDEDIELESKFGIHILQRGEKKLGYLYNMRESIHRVHGMGREIAGLLLYFIGKDGNTFRATHLYRPYFLVQLVQNCPERLFQLIRATYEDKFTVSEGGVKKICKVDIIEKEDLSLEDHLVGRRRKLLKLSFDNQSQMREGLTEVANHEKETSKYRGSKEEKTYSNDLLKNGDERIDHWILGMLEYDVTYMNRISIDKDIRCGNWYQIDYKKNMYYESNDEKFIPAKFVDQSKIGINSGGSSIGGIIEDDDDSLASLQRQIENGIIGSNNLANPHNSASAPPSSANNNSFSTITTSSSSNGVGEKVDYQLTKCTHVDMPDKPSWRIFAYDIECIKEPLKFPDPIKDGISLISVMADGLGFLIVNRDIIVKDIADFEYSPKPEYEGIFKIYNEINEAAMLMRFYQLIREVGPHVITTFNGDFFDFNYIRVRSDILLGGPDSFDPEIEPKPQETVMYKEVGIAQERGGYFTGKFITHLDCYAWVQRDSYLPLGSRGLKMVCKYKLKYEPIELDPELMTPYCYDMEKCQILSEYSVSDAVATYYLFMKYIHDFVFALCSIIPYPPDDVLRKGSGTLCESLLMREGFASNVVFPNKHHEATIDFHKATNKLIEQKTYEGARVECMRVGVFRADFKERFKLEPEAFRVLLDEARDTCKFFCEVEEETPISEIVNFDEVVEKLKSELIALCDPDKAQAQIIREEKIEKRASLAGGVPTVVVGMVKKGDKKKDDKKKNEGNNQLLQLVGGCKKDLKDQAAIVVEGDAARKDEHVVIDIKNDKKEDSIDDKKDKEDLKNKDYEMEWVEYEEVVGSAGVKQGGKMRKIRTKRVVLEDDPMIYHLDVGAMYPNIILSNRLQPSAIVQPEFCSSCSYNDPENMCQRKMEWKCRYELYQVKKGEVRGIERNLENPRNLYNHIDKTGKDRSIQKVTWKELNKVEKDKEILSAARILSQKVYKRLKNSYYEDKKDIVCQRANPFYVDTVRNFRDRRYVYKKLNKEWGKKKAAAIESGDPIRIQEANDRCLLFDSLQLAHKCILNSFYGYVMRTGARWHSIEMAGITTFTGSNLIREAREFVDRVGLPIELDTDGIWCMLPKSFPDTFKFKTKGGKDLKMTYSNSVLNLRVDQKYSNTQYQESKNIWFNKDGHQIKFDHAEHQKKFEKQIDRDPTQNTVIITKKEMIPDPNWKPPIIPTINRIQEDIEIMKDAENAADGGNNGGDVEMKDAENAGGEGSGEIKRSIILVDNKKDGKKNIPTAPLIEKITKCTQIAVRKEVRWEMRSENSILFEVDGPYKCMILPASTDADRMLKKRYCVFEDDGSIAELKGFEMKRRGELRLIQVFQEEIFEQGAFLKGKCREEVYADLGKVSNRWLDVLDSKGASLTDDDLIHLISEKKSMSKSVNDSGAQKSVQICCARRLANILGPQILDDSGLQCHLVIASKPAKNSVTERAIPVKVFFCPDEQKRSLLAEWLGEKNLTLEECDMRKVIDWDYYSERLFNTMQKIICIPAVMQRLPNPIPRVPIPDWLLKREKEWNSTEKQMSLNFTLANPVKPNLSLINSPGNDSIGISPSNPQKRKLNALTDMEDVIKVGYKMPRPRGRLYNSANDNQVNVDFGMGPHFHMDFDADVAYQVGADPELQRRMDAEFKSNLDKIKENANLNIGILPELKDLSSNKGQQLDRNGNPMNADGVDANLKDIKAGIFEKQHDPTDQVHWNKKRLQAGQWQIISVEPMELREGGLLRKGDEIWCLRNITEGMGQPTPGLEAEKAVVLGFGSGLGNAVNEMQPQPQPPPSGLMKPPAIPPNKAKQAAVAAKQNQNQANQLGFALSAMIEETPMMESIPENQAIYGGYQKNDYDKYENQQEQRNNRNKDKDDEDPDVMVRFVNDSQVQTISSNWILSFANAGSLILWCVSDNPEHGLFKCELQMKRALRFSTSNPNLENMRRKITIAEAQVGMSVVPGADDPIHGVGNQSNIPGAVDSLGGSNFLGGSLSKISLPNQTKLMYQKEGKIKVINAERPDNYTGQFQEFVQVDWKVYQCDNPTSTNNATTTYNTRTLIRRETTREVPDPVTGLLPFDVTVSFKKVNARPPRNQPFQDDKTGESLILESMIDESEFRIKKEQRTLFKADTSGLIKNTEIEQIFETEEPLLLRFLSQCGSRISIATERLSQAQKKNFKFKFKDINVLERGVGEDLTGLGIEAHVFQMDSNDGFQNNSKKTNKDVMLTNSVRRHCFLHIYVDKGPGQTAQRAIFGIYVPSRNLCLMILAGKTPKDLLGGKTPPKDLLNGEERSEEVQAEIEELEDEMYYKFISLHQKYLTRDGVADKQALDCLECAIITCEDWSELAHEAQIQLHRMYEMTGHLIYILSSNIEVQELRGLGIGGSNTSIQPVYVSNENGENGEEGMDGLVEGSLAVGGNANPDGKKNGSKKEAGTVHHRRELPFLRNGPVAVIDNDVKAYSIFPEKNDRKWWSWALKKFRQSTVGCHGVWEDTLSYAKMCNLPVCNVANKEVKSLCWDLFFNRQLKQKGIMSWASGNASPDIGSVRISKEDDIEQNSNMLKRLVTKQENRLEFAANMTTQAVVQKNTTIGIDEIEVENQPGIYRSVCVVLKFHNTLVFNAIVMALEISDEFNGEISAYRRNRQEKKQEILDHPEECGVPVFESLMRCTQDVLASARDSAERAEEVKVKLVKQAQPSSGTESPGTSSSGGAGQQYPEVYQVLRDLAIEKKFAKKYGEENIKKYYAEKRMNMTKKARRTTTVVSVNKKRNIGEIGEHRGDVEMLNTSDDDEVECNDDAESLDDAENENAGFGDASQLDRDHDDMDVNMGVENNTGGLNEQGRNDQGLNDHNNVQNLFSDKSLTKKSLTEAESIELAEELERFDLSFEVTEDTIEDLIDLLIENPLVLADLPLQVLQNVLKLYIYKRDASCVSALCEYIYTWLCNPKSHLYDPAVLKKVNSYVQKTFDLLLRELGRRCDIIHANQSQVILSTGKLRYDEALYHFEGIREDLDSHPFLHMMTTGFRLSNITEYYMGLLWFDQNNFVGFALEPEMFGDAKKTKKTAEMIDISPPVDEQLSAPHHQWIALEQLPKVVHTAFKGYLKNYLQVGMKYLLEKKAGMGKNISGNNLVSSMGDDEVIAVLRNYISRDLTPKIQSYVSGLAPSYSQDLNLIKSCEKKISELESLGMDSDSSDDPEKIEKVCDRRIDIANLHKKAENLRMKWAFQDKPPPYKPWRPLGLEFSHMLITMLKLEPRLSEDVDYLFKQLLVLLKIDLPHVLREEWQPNYLALHLHYCECPKCGVVNTIDVVTNPIHHEKGGEFYCIECFDGTYPQLIIEHKLIVLAERIIQGYSQQEITCKACMKLKEDVLFPYCVYCSTKLENKFSKHMTILLWKTLGKIAENRNFHSLKEIIDLYGPFLEG